MGDSFRTQSWLPEPTEPVAKALPLATRPIRESKSIVVINSLPEQTNWLTAVLGNHHRISTAASAAAVVELAKTTIIDLVVADSKQCGRPFLDTLSSAGLSGSVLFLARDESIDSLVHALATNHSISIFYDGDDGEKLLSHVNQILFPRTDERHVREELTVEVNGAGFEKMRFPVVDISNRGLAFRLEPDLLKRTLLPGGWIEHIRVVDKDVVLVDGVSAIVRHLVPGSVAPNSAEEPPYRVGLELVPPSRSPARAQRVVRDRLEMLSIFDSLRMEHVSLRVEHPYDPAESWSCSLQSIDRERNEITLSGRSTTPLLLGDVLKIIFEFTGASHHCYASVKDVADYSVSPASNDKTVFRIRLPRALAVVRRRKMGRFQPTTEQPVLVEITSPFSTGTVVTSAVDLTTAGLAFLIRDGSDLFPVGSNISQLKIRFPSGTEVVADAIVRSLGSWQEDASQSRCGLQFISTSASDRARIADEIMLFKQPRVRDGSKLSFDELWRFLDECGFLYSEKRKSLDEMAIRATFSALLSRPNGVSKTLLCYQEERILGHVSAIQTYQNTWSIQHLAALNDDNAISQARLLNIACADYFQQHPEIEWFKLYYRPNNRWPDRIFGSFARRLIDSKSTDIRTFNYLIRETDGDSFDFEGTGYTLRPAKASDVSYFESCLLRHDRAIDLRAMDISFDDLELSRVNSQYSEIGLERRREVLVVERNGRCGGFGLLEFASPGLNLSELTNSFSLYSLDDDLVALRILAEAARERYRSQGRRYAICLTENAHVQRACEDAGFANKKQYTAWTFHRTVYDEFHKYARRRFG